MTSTAPGGRIPTGNLWLLLIYASGLARFSEALDAEVDDDEDLPDLFARLLSHVLERRLRRNLTRAYVPDAAVLRRVRGRIDVGRTLLHDELRRGRVACRFESLTADTPRNRLVRTALARIAARVRNPELGTRCRNLVQALDRFGVSSAPPSRAEMARDQIGRHDADDRLMVAVARMALDPHLPTETVGDMRLTRLARDEMILWRVFEAGIAGFYDHEARALGWSASPQRLLDWFPEDPTDGLIPLLPTMRPDLCLDHLGSGRRIILDTKFSNILRPRWRGDGMTFSSANLYQVYSYVHSQAGRGDVKADGAEALLLHPSVGCEVDESVTVQGHRIRFATLDLGERPEQVRERLFYLLD